MVPDLSQSGPNPFILSNKVCSDCLHPPSVNSHRRGQGEKKFKEAMNCQTIQKLYGIVTSRFLLAVLK